MVSRSNEKRVYALCVIRMKNKHAAREETAANEHEQHVLARIRARARRARV